MLTSRHYATDAPQTMPCLSSPLQRAFVLSQITLACDGSFAIQIPRRLFPQHQRQQRPIAVAANRLQMKIHNTGNEKSELCEIFSQKSSDFEN
jgi:hypothetical protein